MEGRHASKGRKERAAGSFATTVFASLAVVFVIVAVTSLPDGRLGRRTIAFQCSGSESAPAGGGISATLGKLIQSSTSATLHDDFHTGFGNWKASKSLTSDWSANAGEVASGILAAVETIYQPFQL